MDSLILLIRTMSDLTNHRRRRRRRNDLVEPYKTLMEDEKNPPTPDWLGGDDVPAAIRKAKANAGLADDIARRGKWPKKSFNRNSKNFGKPYDLSNKKKNPQYNPRDNDSNHQGGYRSSSRGRGEHRNSNERRSDFYRRDSR